MIFKETVLNKMIKDAWRAGCLGMGRKGDKFIISGGWWIIEIDNERLSNKVKGKLMELTGILPEVGEFYQCSDEGNQMQVPETLTDKLDNMKERPVIDCWEKSNILIDVGLYYGRIFQAPNSGQKVVIKDMITELLKGKQEPGDDLNIFGPVVEGKDGKPSLLCWKNRQVVLVVAPVKMIIGDYALDKKEKVWEQISSIDLIAGTNV